MAWSWWKIVALSAGLWSVALEGLVAQPLPDPLPCTSCFIGKLKLNENPGDPSGRTKKLGEDLYFVDPSKFVWKAGKDDITDGASIPPLFQPIIGGAFEADFLPAAVIHDHYTNKDHRVRPWRDTARVFYQAMIVNGVNVIKAKTMYYAVYSFGPHWDVLIKGVPCGKNCTFKVPFDVQILANGDIFPTMSPKIVPFGMQFAEEPADYNAAHEKELRDIQAKISASEIQGEPLSLEHLALLAKLSHGDNVFISTNTSK
jgi:hypothetical protein